MEAACIVNNLLEGEDIPPENIPPEDAEVERYLQQVTPQRPRLSKGFIRYLLSTPEGRKFLLHLRDKPEPPSEPHQIVREAIGDEPPPPEDELPHSELPSPYEPEDTKAEIERLLPIKTYHLRGSSMIHAPGLIRIAQNEWQHSRSRKQKTWAMNIMKSWTGLPEEVYLAILNGKAEIETQGDDAIVTIRLY